MCIKRNALPLRPPTSIEVKRGRAHLVTLGVWSVIVAECARLSIPLNIALAIMWRETRFGTIIGPRTNWTGDHGHGRGLWQVDDRHHTQYTSRFKNDDHAANTRYALGLLRKEIQNAGPGNLDVGIAAYNTRPKCAKLSKQQFGHADAYTYGGNYSADVLASAKVIAAHLPGFGIDPKQVLALATLAVLALVAIW